jgi:hypothetical protein
MVGRFNILDYWAQLAQRPVVCWSLVKSVKQKEISCEESALIRYRIGTEVVRGEVSRVLEEDG